MGSWSYSSLEDPDKENSESGSYTANGSYSASGSYIQRGS